MATLQKIALVLVIVGALNWALVGLFELDLVALLFGSAKHIIARIIYVVIGVCGLIDIGLFFEQKK
ncbi:MAG: DUF378 domain-containing protein [Bacilli bacterium]